jgi:hypothetical protein
MTHNLDRLRVRLESLKDEALHALPVDQLRLKRTIHFVTVALEAVDQDRQATQHAIQRQRIEEEAMMAVLMAVNEETGLLEELDRKDAEISS